MLTALAAALVCAASRACGAFCEFAVERTGDGRSAVAEAVVYPYGLAADARRTTVLAENGDAVPHQWIWQGEGDPWVLRFDTSQGSRWTIRIADGAVPEAAAPWTAPAGVMIETRALPAGAAVDTLDDFQHLWSSAPTVLGRSTVGAIFHGTYPHGFDRPLLARYDGWLAIPAAGRYRVSVLADDAVFLLVDDRLLASWGGWHTVQGHEREGRGGEVDLAKGLCRITVLNAQKDNEFLVAAYWQPPGAGQAVPIPSGAFAPVAATRIVSAASSREEADAAAFGWAVDSHVLADGRLWVRMNLRLLAPRDGVTYAWELDDGTTAAGTNLTHLFFAPGSREVTVQARQAGREIGRLRRHVRVHAKGLQRAEFDPAAFERLRGELLQRDYARLPVDDLCQAVLLADAVQDLPLLTVFGESALARPGAFAPDRMPAIYRLGFHFQHPSLRRYDDAALLWRALIGRPGVEPGLAARTRLHLAGMLIHSGRGLGEALSLLQACATGDLNDGERRLHLIYRGDAAAAAGDREQALRLYREAGGTVAVADTVFEVRRAARLERARSYLNVAEYDAAEATLRELEWERPVSRAGLETGLLLIEVFRGRGEMENALAMCRRLGAVAPEGPRQADLLQKTVEICEALGFNDEAQAARRRLEAEFPYSEASARLRPRPQNTGAFEREQQP